MSFKYFLNDTEILEPFGFDGATIKIEQKENSFARDVYLFNENIELVFYKNTFTGNLSHGFDIIEQELENKGFDAEIKLKIEKNGLPYFLGRLDLENLITDTTTYYKIKTIDEGGRFLFKRDFDTKKKIELIPTKVLLKAKPVEQVSEFETESNKQYNFTGFGNFYNPFYVQKKANIKNTLIPFYDHISWNGMNNDPATWNFKLIHAISPLSNVKIRLKCDIKITINQNTNPQPISCHCYSYITVDSVYPSTYEPFFENLITQNNGVYTLSIDETIAYNEIAQGLNIYMYFRSSTMGDSNYSIEFSNSYLSIIATSTSINSVIDAYRWKDLMQATSNLPVKAPLFESGGEFYNTVLTNGYGIRSIKGKEFYTTAKDVFDIQFLALDYQVNANTIEIGTFEDFYPNKEIVLLNDIYAEDIEVVPNNRFRISDIKIGFSKYEQDRDEENTLDSVHTYSEWKMPNKYTQGKFERLTDIIFDVYKIESTRRLGFEDRTKNSSLSNDDDLFGITITPIGEENTQTYRGSFSQLTNGNTLQLLTNSFSWYSTGIEVGDTIEITGSNANTYTVLEINDIGNIIKLNGTNNGVNAEEILTITYTLSNVHYKSKTSEGYASIIGVSNPLNYGNLQFQQKRILNRWSGYLATAKLHYPNENIKLNFFKNNKQLEVDTIKDFTDLELTNISTILQEYNAKVQAKCSYENAILIAHKFTQRNSDNTIGGYITIDNVTGFVKFFEYNLVSEILNLTIELKENEYLLTEDGQYLITEDGSRIIV